MNVTDLQSALNALGSTPPLAVDGRPGKLTFGALDRELDEHRVADRGWSDRRKFVAVEQLLYASLGIEVGKIDGLVGPQTLYAREVYAARLAGDTSIETWRDAEEAKPAPAPPPKATVWPRQKDVAAFFGKPGAHQVRLTLPYPMRLAWDMDVTVNAFACHERVAPTLTRIFAGTLAHYGMDGIERLRLDRFGGCFNNRKMRGGSALSMHAYAIAVDIDPERNQYKWRADKATLDAAAYEPFWRLVEGEGGISLGRARGFDWMHYQFARL